MINRSPSEFEFRDDYLLPVAELLHRVRNEYARSICLASLIAAKSSSDETKAALRDVINHLHATAEVHSVLRPPVGEVHADFTEILTRLCRVMTASSEFQYRGIKLELRVDHPILIDAGRCWRASLVVSELINNSFRHAFGSRSGCIFVTVGESNDRVFCTVNDDGTPAEIGGAGLGTRLTDALAAEIGGVVERMFSKSGAAVTLFFPKRRFAVSQIDEDSVGQNGIWQARKLGARRGRECESPLRTKQCLTPLLRNRMQKTVTGLQ